MPGFGHRKSTFKNSNALSSRVSDFYSTHSSFPASISDEVASVRLLRWRGQISHRPLSQIILFLQVRISKSLNTVPVNSISQSSYQMEIVLHAREQPHYH